MKTLSADYPVWLCDIWGVVHNGLKGYEAALATVKTAALAAH